MGNGNRDGELLNFQITANYSMTPADRGRWTRAFSKASELLWNATEGQLRFGNIWITDNSAGINNAEFVLDNSPTGRATGTRGDWGVIGRSVTLLVSAQRGVLTILHEIGHHLFNLDEEYARAEFASVDSDAVLPAGHNNQIIPISGTLNSPDADYAGADALVRFAGLEIETKSIVSKVGNFITVDSAYSQSPVNDESGAITIQWVDDVECTGDKATGACIMEFSHTDAGALEPDGTWNPAAQPVTEFCTTDNHDTDTDTAQQARHGEACWETITAATGFTDLANAAPDPAGPANTTEPGGWAAPVLTVLDPNIRLALVLDRSGSMNRNSGARLAGAKTGASFWIENAAVEDDQLTIIWYNGGRTVQLPLSDFGSLSGQNVQDQLDLIEAQTADGGTDILGALTAALNQLEGPGTPAQVQASLLITDGAHNFPPGTDMSDIIPNYRAANSSIYTLGVGSGGEMDVLGLDGLAAQTGGTSHLAGDGSDADAIQTEMIRINGAIRGGMISGAGSGGADSRRVDDALDPFVKEASDLQPTKRPTLKELTANFKVLPWEKAIEAQGKVPHRFVWWGVDIEEEVTSTTFTISHSPTGDYWLYLIDPDGREVHPSDSNVAAWSHTSNPFEFAKIEKPAPGQWTVLGLRLDRGPAIHTRFVAAINHPEVSVYARATATGHSCPVRINAGARWRDLLTGLAAEAVVRTTSGQIHRVTLHDDDGDGDYTGWADLPDGHYTGHVEIRSPRNPPAANMHHTILHAPDLRKVPPARLKTDAFERHVPISFTIGAVKVPQGIPEDEV